MSQIDRDKPIERVSNPQPNTEERREAAEVIEREWPKDTTLTEMADMAGYSRQHMVNAVDSHFRYLEPENGLERTEFEGDTVEVPTDIIDDEKAIRAFVRGYRSGFTMAKAI